MQTVTSADGTEIAYDLQGTGRPLLLLHGGGGRQYWDPLAPRFVEDYAVVRPDRRGYGDSKLAEAYGLEREIEDVQAVLEAARTDSAVEDDEPILVGHSFGGLQALETARLEPVAAIAAYEPAILVGECSERSDLADQMAARLGMDDQRGAMKLHLREVLHTDDVSDAEFEAWLEGWPHWPEAARGAERTLAMDRVVETYELPETIDLGAPGLVLSGTEGPSHLRDSSRALAEALVDGEFHEYEGVSHMGPAEAPERVTETLWEFFDANGCSPRAAGSL
ncbi:alpha/beta fold hydrolase [Salinarchaeum laminariae]|uniref:alpha/beta fold hydrolase n=1 Tax=Salinarchaeum laminariae TaxID=869888 RepID=UPI0020BDF005|nr:alpha/beta hydrolase [Salinarchaeum laminariae]